MAGNLGIDLKKLLEQNDIQPQKALDSQGIIGQLLNLPKDIGDNVDAGNKLIQALIGSQIQNKTQEIVNPEEQPLNIKQQALVSDMKKTATIEIEDAKAQGATLEQMGQSVGVDEFGKIDPNFSASQIGQQLQGFAQSQQQQERFPQDQGDGLFKRILIGMARGGSQDFRKGEAAIASTKATTALNEQKLAGEAPLQKGEREKIEITAFGNLLKTGNKAVSAETAKLLGNTKSGIEQIGLLEQTFDTDPGAFKSFTTLGNPNAQLVKTTLNDVKDILGRLRSGGAINEDELKGFTKQLPNFGFLKGRIESPQIVKFKLQKLKKLFSEIQSLAQPKQNDIPQRVQAARQAGFSQEEIRSAFKRQGFL